MPEHIDSFSDTGLSNGQISILEHVTLYYLGVEFENDDKKWQLGVNNPPDIGLFASFAGYEYSKKPYGDDVRFLLESDLTRRERLLQKTIDWAPTQRARRIAKKDILDKYGSFIPDCLINERNGLATDPDETITHRLGVEVALKAVPRMNWSNGIYELYPGYQGQSRPDLQAIWNDGGVINIEVLTQYTSHRHRLKKLREMRDWNHPVMVVFDSRAQANKMLNYWQRKELDFEVKNFPIESPEDRALKHVNSYIEKSWGSDRYDTYSICAVHSINELHRHYIRDW